MNRFTPRRLMAVVAIGALTVGAAGCSAGSDSSADTAKVTITVSGPNQWNSDPSSFGKPWEDMVARFEKAEPGIKVETNVLPLTSFRDTLSTQLAAGSAPELIFNQVPHDPKQIVSMNKYLEKPNPFAPDADTWLDVFNPNMFGENQRNALGDFEYIPLNAVGTGLFYNKDAFDKAGIDRVPTSITGLLKDCKALKKAGYTPLAMDSGSLGVGWTSETIYNMLLNKYAKDWDRYTKAGDPGDNGGIVTQKSIAAAISTGELDATKTPEVREAVKLTKQIFDGCATPNWSGIAGTATFVGADEFLSGDAAIAWGTSFAAAGLSKVDWAWAAFPFPTVTSQDTPLSTDAPAQSGIGVGGTSYMIPATTKGKKLAAAVKFLQFASSPKGGEKWLKETGSIPATVGAEPSEGIKPLLEGAWAEPKQISLPYRSKASAGKNLLEGYLLGTKTLDEQLASLENEWSTWSDETAQSAGWTDDWVKK